MAVSPYNERITEDLLKILEGPGFVSFRRVCDRSITTYRERQLAAQKYFKLLEGAAQKKREQTDSNNP